MSARKRSAATFALYAIPNQADTLVLHIVTQNRFRNWGFQVIDFDIQQMFNEWFCNVFIAENEPEHNRVGNVKVVKRLYAHNMPPLSLEALIYNGKFSKSKTLQILQTVDCKFVYFVNSWLQNNKATTSAVNVAMGSLQNGMTEASKESLWLIL